MLVLPSYNNNNNPTTSKPRRNMGRPLQRRGAIAVCHCH